MRILLLSQHARPWGGIEQHVRDLALGLRDRGGVIGLAYAAAVAGADAVDPEYAGAFDAVLAASPDADPAVAKSAARQLVADFTPDVVYLHKWEHAALPRALSLLVPVVMMSHDHDLTCPRRHRYTLVGRVNCDRPAGSACIQCFPWLGRKPGTRITPQTRSLRGFFDRLAFARELPRVVVASAMMRDDLVTNGVAPGRVTVIPPVPRAPLPPEPSPPAVDGPMTILCVGQLVRTKGQDLLIAAWNQMADPPRLVLVGDGNDRARLRSQIRRTRFPERAELRGRVAHADLPAVYADATVVAVPSRWKEPFGLVGLEAMAHARPVVAFDVGGIRSWLRDGQTGRLVAPGSITGLRDALQAVADDRSAAAEWGREGRRVRESEFSYSGMLDEIEQLLEAAAR
jgi:glycosyltransferase involved in cell wall biosynthesis